MAALTQQQKTEHYDYFVENLVFETVLLGVFGGELVKAIVEHIGRNNFFRAYKNLRQGDNYKTIPALKDTSRALAFVNGNKELVGDALTRLALKMSGLPGEEVLTTHIKQGILKNSPYEIKNLQLMIEKGDEYKGADAQEMKKWFDDKVINMNEALIANQACLAAYGVTNEKHSFDVVQEGIFGDDSSNPAFAAFCLSLIKTLSFMTAETFEAYLKKQDKLIDNA